MGQYHTKYIFPFSEEQWNNVPQGVRKRRLDRIPNSASGYLKRHGLTRADFIEVVESGKWQFDVIVVECVGFDEDFYKQCHSARGNLKKGS